MSFVELYVFEVSRIFCDVSVPKLEYHFERAWRTNRSKANKQAIILGLLFLN